MRRTETRETNSTAPEGNAEIIDPTDLARYISEMSGEMASLSKRAGWPMVTYFLEMAQLQAQERLRQRALASPSARQRRRNGKS